jgi:hypothetical protein
MARKRNTDPAVGQRDRDRMVGRARLYVNLAENG